MSRESAHYDCAARHSNAAPWHSIAVRYVHFVAWTYSFAGSAATDPSVAGSGSSCTPIAAELDYRDYAAISSDMGGILRRTVEASSRPRGEAAAGFLRAITTGRAS
ncbi:hypothetical protein [Sphingomonas spermidinifaciens]|uniref:hypothetical protein n=1 Tax=Sphingomonas spermidinifaciens TaxID=1141889 RepID=UPI001143747A|nr:hypothetical protein [Sphingomonas spermidinifaciens]